MRQQIMLLVTQFIIVTLVLFLGTTVSVLILRYGGWLLSISDSCPITEVK